MRRLGEPALWIGLLAVLSGLVFIEGRRRTDLERKVALGPKELYARLARSQVRWQVVDVRPNPSQAFDENHVPGALPFPGCDPAGTPEKAQGRILRSVPTIIISSDGSSEAFSRCAAEFTSARNLAGGMTAWDDANLPEDSGEYAPPSNQAGGGCL